MTEGKKGGGGGGNYQLTKKRIIYVHHVNPRIPPPPSPTHHYIGEGEERVAKNEEIFLYVWRGLEAGTFLLAIPNCFTFQAHYTSRSLVFPDGVNFPAMCVRNIIVNWTVTLSVLYLVRFGEKKRLMYLKVGTVNYVRTAVVNWYLQYTLNKQIGFL